LVDLSQAQRITRLRFFSVDSVAERGSQKVQGYLCICPRHSANLLCDWTVVTLSSEHLDTMYKVIGGFVPGEGQILTVIEHG
jgi:hypothetical protein